MCFETVQVGDSVESEYFETPHRSELLDKVPQEGPINFDTLKSKLSQILKRVLLSFDNNRSSERKKTDPF